MKLSLLLALALLASPATARADLVFKCKSVVFSDQLGASLRFEENGKSGQIELDYWNGYPPIGLVYGELKAPTLKGGFVAFPNVRDTHSGYSAELTVPSTFLSADDFTAKIGLTPKAGPKKIYDLNCNRF